MTDHSTRRAGDPRVDDVRWARATQRWVRAYTRGLPPDAARERADEIRCDLHHQLAAAAHDGTSPEAVSRAIAIRMLLGVPADLSWRWQTLRARRAAGRRERTVHRPSSEQVPRLVAVAAGVLVLGWALYFGIGFTIVSRSGEWTDGTWMGPTLVAVSLLGVVGLVLVARGVPEGAYGLALVALASTAWLLWVPIVPVVGLFVACGFVAYAVLFRRRRVVAAT